MRNLPVGGVLCAAGAEIVVDTRGRGTTHEPRAQRRSEPAPLPGWSGYRGRRGGAAVRRSVRPTHSPPDHARWRDARGARDDHPRRLGHRPCAGKTDADAVFGMIYAQAEDDFNRIETNYLISLGRLAEAEGESAIWQDLRQRLFIDPDELKRDYADEPGLAAQADGGLGGRAELLPRHAPRGAAAGDHAVRAVDGAELHRRQHRRRHRADRSPSSRPSTTSGAVPRPRRAAALFTRAARLERLRHRAEPHARTATRCC